MNKFYVGLLVALLAMVGLHANAASGTVNFSIKLPAEVASDFTFYAQWGEDDFDMISPNEEGIANFSLPYDDENTDVYNGATYVYWENMGSGTLQGITDKDGNDATEGNYGFMSSYDGLMLMPNSACEGQVFTFDVVLPEDDTNVVVEVDDASKVTMSKFSGTEVELRNGAFNYPFASAVDFPLTIMNKNSYDPFAAGDEPNLGIYQVTVNQEVVEPNAYGVWEITPNNYDVIVITTVWPEEKVNFTIELPEGCESFVKDVKVNDEAVDYINQPLNLQIGSNVYVTFNTDDYKLKDMKVNGETPANFNASYTKYWNGQLRGDVTLTLDVEKYQMIKVKVSTNNPEVVYVSTGTYYAEKNKIELVAGEEKEIEISSKTAALAWKLTDEGKVNYGLEPKLNGEILYEKDWQGNLTDKPATSVKELKDGDKIEVNAKETVRDKSLILLAYGYDEYMDGNETGWYTFERTGYVKIPVVDGYQEVPFCDADLPFDFQSYNSKGDDYVEVAYLNDEKVEKSGYEPLSFNVQEGDVLKLYVLDQPKTFTATFEAPAEMEATELEVTKDRVIPVMDWKNGVSSLTGTEVSFKLNPANGYDYGVKIDGEDATADNDGKYTVVLEANHEVTISKTLGVEKLINGEKSTYDVYNMQGIRVMRNAGAADMNNLPKGVYIINGKKVVK